LANFGTACSSFIVVIIWPVGGTVEGKGERKRRGRGGECEKRKTGGEEKERDFFFI